MGELGVMTPPKAIKLAYADRAGNPWLFKKKWHDKQSVVFVSFSSIDNPGGGVVKRLEVVSRGVVEGRVVPAPVVVATVVVVVAPWQGPGTH